MAKVSVPNTSAVVQRVLNGIQTYDEYLEPVFIYVEAYSAERLIYTFQALSFQSRASIYIKKRPLVVQFLSLLYGPYVEIHVHPSCLWASQSFFFAVFIPQSLCVHQHIKFCATVAPTSPGYAVLCYCLWQNHASALAFVV